VQELLSSIIDQVRGAWRFRRVALIAAWLFAIAGWVVAAVTVLLVCCVVISARASLADSP